MTEQAIPFAPHAAHRPSRQVSGVFSFEKI